MQRIAAGLLMYRREKGVTEYFLVHPGGPFFRNRQEGFWTIPKGEPEKGEDLLEAAQREFSEETGIRPVSPFHPLESVRQKGGKIVYAWAFEGSWDPETGIECNTFMLEWPPRSGKKMAFPEVDQAQWFDYDLAKQMIIPEQIPLLDRTKQFIKN